MGVKNGADCIVISQRQEHFHFSPVNEWWIDIRLISCNAQRRILLGVETGAGVTFLDQSGRPLRVNCSARRGATAINPAIRIGELREPPRSRCEKAHSSAERSPFHVMVGRCQLDEPLQVLPDLRFRGQPDRLPRLVRFPELLRVEMRQALQEMRTEVGFQFCPLRSMSQMPAVKSAVVPVPPMSRVRSSGPPESSLSTASWIRLAASVSWMWCSIMMAD